MNNKMRVLAAGMLMALAFTVPATVVARGDQQDSQEEPDEQMEEFEPTETVDADEAISFPVDI